MRSYFACMERRELRHDQHMVSLLTDHTVFSPKYHGKILVGDVALALDGIIRKTYKDPDIDMAMNVDQVHLFVEYPPKYSVSYIAKRMKGRGVDNCAGHFPTSKNGSDWISGFLGG